MHPGHSGSREGQALPQPGIKCKLPRCPAGGFGIKGDLASSRRGWEGLDQAAGAAEVASVRLFIQEAGEHGEGGLGHVRGDHVSSALRSKAL